jgi:hypothetical protein
MDEFTTTAMMAAAVSKAVTTAMVAATVDTTAFIQLQWQQT